jgi:hypothetical protein
MQTVRKSAPGLIRGVRGGDWFGGRHAERVGQDGRIPRWTAQLTAAMSMSPTPDTSLQEVHPGR